MSKLDELIKTLCPDGVEYRTIGELITRCREKAKDYPLITTVYAVSNTQGLVCSSEYRENEIHSEDTSNYLVVQPQMFVYNPARLNIGSIAYLQGNAGLVSPMYVVFSVNNNLILNEYLFTLIRTPKIMTKICSMVETGARFRFDFSRWDNVQIPVPPLEVQEKIMSYLNKFKEYSAELTAELTARKKQYEYYRDELLTFDENVEYKSIKEVADNYTGLTYKPDNVSQSGTLVLRSSNIKNSRLSFADNVYVSGINIPDRAIAQENDILICVRNGSSALIGKSALIPKTDKPMAFGAFMTVLRAKENVYYKYLYYAWQTTRVQRMAHGDDAMPINQITNREFARITIPLPSMDKQIEIANLLDRFDALCNDISIGLPAEIEARQKQYEYYRDKLLTFREVS